MAALSSVQMFQSCDEKIAMLSGNSADGSVFTRATLNSSRVLFDSSVFR